MQLPVNLTQKLPYSDDMTATVPPLKVKGSWGEQCDVKIMVRRKSYGMQKEERPREQRFPLRSKIER